MLAHFLQRYIMRLLQNKSHFRLKTEADRKSEGRQMKNDVGMRCKAKKVCFRDATN